jgi:hypothetical protein
MRDTHYWGLPYDLFRQLSCTSRMALASLFDLYINKGRYYPINLIQVDFEAIDANETLSEAEKEAQKIYQINQRGNEEENGLNDTKSLEFDDRRNAMRDQGGNYFGLLYDPDVQFDMNQEPAISEKTAGDLNIKIGSIDVDNVFLGDTPISKIYLGATLLGSAEPEPYTTSKVPDTQFRTNPNSYEGFESGSITLTQGQPLWIDVQNFVACKTYYTIDGSTPTTASTLYTGALTFNTSCTLKALTVSIFGVAEAVKTLTITVAVAPTTTISPTETVQNTIPFTVTLTTSESGAAIKYRLGNSATVYNYSAPFEITQTTGGMNSTQLKVTYWAVGASATEIEKVITYNTSGAIPAKSTLTATAGNNQVALSWTATANTTSYSVFRSTAAGTKGTVLTGAQYITATTFTDTTAVNGTTYYYTVDSGNYGTATPSDQKSATPAAPAGKPTYRYIKFDSYGGTTAGALDTTRAIELEVWSGGTNRLNGKSSIAPQPATPNSGATAIPVVAMTNGVKTTTTNTYPIWWTTTPNARVVFDMGAQYAIDQIKYFSYSLSGDQRAYKFIVLGSNTNNGTDWAEIWNMSGNTTVQPILPNGYESPLY